MRLAAFLIALATTCSTAVGATCDQDAERTSDTSVAAVHAASTGNSTPIQPKKTPSQLRAAVLYSDREFSTFRHPSERSQGALTETAARRAPLDRQTEDAWIARDKAQHLSFSFLWTLGTQYVVVNKGRISEHRALPVSITSSALVGVTKEVYDLRSGPPHVFSYKDLAANAVGILLAAGLILL